MAYEKIKKEETILRDELAIERTKLAVERTSLSYIRTGMNLALAGFFFVGYFQAGSSFTLIGYLTIALAVVFTGYGFYKHEKSKRFIKKLVDGLNGFLEED